MKFVIHAFTGDGDIGRRTHSVKMLNMSVAVPLSWPVHDVGSIEEPIDP